MFCDGRGTYLLDKNHVHPDLLWASNIFLGKTSTGFESIRTAEGGLQVWETPTSYEVGLVINSPGGS